MVKKDQYQLIRIAGFISLIPIVLIAGPWTGYWSFIVVKHLFHISDYWGIIFILVFTLASIFETIRIMKLVVRLDSKK